MASVEFVDGRCSAGDVGLRVGIDGIVESPGSVKYLVSVSKRLSRLYRMNGCAWILSLAELVDVVGKQGGEHEKMLILEPELQ